jgi:hypothetical protein
MGEVQYETMRGLSGKLLSTSKSVKFLSPLEKIYA